MPRLWELVTVRRWLNDRVVYCNCHSVVAILHKQGQMKPDRNRNTGGRPVGRHYTSRCLLSSAVCLSLQAERHNNQSAPNQFLGHTEIYV